MKKTRKPSPVLTEIMSNITDEDREKTRKEMEEFLEGMVNASNLSALGKFDGTIHPEAETESRIH